jgi:peptidoglycan-N-acetylglucosamine deacetylase
LQGVIPDLSVATMGRRIARIFFAVAIGLLGLAAIIYLTPPRWIVERLARRFPGCLYHVPTQEPLVALTIDDGPDPLTTPRILNQLHRHEAKATFFLITSRIPGHESLVQQMVNEQHELGNHFTRDRASIALDSGAFERDLLQSHQSLSRWSRPRWARPGSGRYSQSMLRVMQRQRYGCALGSVYPLDAAIPSSAWASSYILRHVRPGAVVILHDGGSRGQRTVRVLAKVLPELRRRGFRVVTLNELLEVVTSR